MRRLTAAIKARRHSHQVVDAAQYGRHEDDAYRRCESPDSEPSPRHDALSERSLSAHQEPSPVPSASDVLVGGASTASYSSTTCDPSLQSAASIATIVYSRAVSTSPRRPETAPRQTATWTFAVVGQPMDTHTRSPLCAGGRYTHCAMVRHGYVLGTGCCVTCASDSSLSSSLASTPDTSSGGDASLSVRHSTCTSGQTSRSMRRRASSASFVGSNQRVVPELV